MTHAYSAGGSRQAAVLAAIVGLHVAVLLLVLNDQVGWFRPTGPPNPGRSRCCPPSREPPVIVRPDESVLVGTVRPIALKSP